MTRDVVRPFLRVLGAEAAGWFLSHPRISVLLLATAGGFILQPLADGLHRQVLPVRLDVPTSLLGGRGSPADLIWLVFALALCGALLWARAGVRDDLVGGVRGLFSTGRGQTGSRQTSGGAVPDLPNTAPAIVCSLFDLGLLLVVHHVLRSPLVAVAAAYAPRAWVDGAFVLVVLTLTLVLLSRLRRTSRPPIEYLAGSALDRIVPTAGYSGHQPSTAPVSGSSATPKAVEVPSVLPGQAVAAARPEVTPSPSTSRGTTPPASEVVPGGGAAALAGALSLSRQQPASGGDKTDFGETAWFPGIVPDSEPAEAAVERSLDQAAGRRRGREDGGR